MQRLTHLGRPIDPRYPSNRVAIVVPLAIGILVAALADGSILDRGLEGGIALVASFLAWALGREIDPDRTATANVAAVVGGLLAGALGSAALGALYLLMATARITTRTTGLPPKVGDLVVHVAAAAFFASTPAGWAAGMVLAAAMARDVALPGPAPRVQVWYGAVTAAAVTVVAALRGAFGTWIGPDVVQWALVAAGLVGAVIVLRPESPTSTCDYTPDRVDPVRLQWGRLLVASGLVLALVVAGAPGVRALAAGWATIAVAGVVRLAVRSD